MILFKDRIPNTAVKASVSRKPRETDGQSRQRELEEDSPPPLTDFGKQLRHWLLCDFEKVDPVSKYTAFWLNRGLPLASQFRQASPWCYFTSTLTSLRLLLISLPPLHFLSYLTACPNDGELVDSIKLSLPVFITRHLFTVQDLQGWFLERRLGRTF